MEQHIVEHNYTWKGQITEYMVSSHKLKDGDNKVQDLILQIFAHL